MAIILERSSHRWSDLTTAQVRIEDALARIERFNRTAAGGASDAELEAAYGIPAAVMSIPNVGAKAVLADVESALNDPAVLTFLSQLI